MKGVGPGVGIQCLYTTIILPWNGGSFHLMIPGGINQQSIYNILHPQPGQWSRFISPSVPVVAHQRRQVGT